LVILNKIYTRSGDDGTTALADGQRRPKHDLRIAAYGAVDEANTSIGLARLYTPDFPPLDDILAKLQNDLFDLGADLATPFTEGEADKESDKEKNTLRIIPQQIERVEAEIDQLNSELAPLTSFILPGGNAAAAHLHFARVLMRRAERQIVACQEQTAKDQLSPLALQFANRASDLLFVAARWANDKGKKDILWEAGKYGKAKTT